MTLLGKILGRITPEEVVKQHGPLVHRHLRRIFGPDADVDDVFQSVFVEVLRSLPKFRGEAKLSTWIRRITWNVAYQEMRLRYQRPRLMSLDSIPSTPTAQTEAPDDAAFRMEAMTKVYRALEELDPKMRLPFVMRDFEGMSLKDIAKHLGRPLPTIASQIDVARKKIVSSVRSDCRVETARERQPDREEQS